MNNLYFSDKKIIKLFSNCHFQCIGIIIKIHTREKINTGMDFYLIELLYYSAISTGFFSL